MDYSKLKLVFSYDWCDEDSDMDEYVVEDLFTIRFLKDKDINEKEYRKFKSIMIPNSQLPHLNL